MALTKKVFLVDSPEYASFEINDFAMEAQAADAGICVEPSVLNSVAPTFEGSGKTVASWAGYPTGRHHALVKASEARLAVEFGATDIAIVPDVTVVSDATKFQSELIAIRDAVPHPAGLGVVLETSKLDAAVLKEAAARAQKAGMDFILTGTTTTKEEGIAAIKEGSDLPLAIVSDHDDAHGYEEKYPSESVWIRM